MPTRQFSYRNTWGAFFYCVIAWILASGLLYTLSNEVLFHGQQYNWVGKGVALVFEVAFVFAIPGYSRKELGMGSRIEWTDASPILIVCGAYFLLRLLLYGASGMASAHIDAETVLFQASLPGLQEELLFRGIMLGLLNRIFPRPVWTFLKVRFGWAAVLTTIVFGLAHGVRLNENHGLSVNYVSFFRTAFDGFLFALLAERTKSIFPGVVYHNLLNLIGNH
jgi:membrane protease YdiL (CAAX protease family)